MRKLYKVMGICLSILLMSMVVVSAEQTTTTYDPRTLWLDDSKSSVSVSIDGVETVLEDNTIETINFDLESISSLVVYLNLTFNLDKAGSPYAGGNIPTNVAFEFEVPKGLVTTLTEAQNLVIQTSNGSKVVIGQVSINDNIVSITFNDRVNDYSNRWTAIILAFSIDVDSMNDNDQVVIAIPSMDKAATSYTIEFHPKVDGTDNKTGSTGILTNGTYSETNTRPSEAYWSILFNVDGESYDTVTITDVFSTNQFLADLSNFHVYKVQVSLSGEESYTEIDISDSLVLCDTGFTLSLTDVNSAILVEYYTTLVQGERGTSSTLSNTAVVTADGTTTVLDGSPITVDWGTSYPEIAKEGTVIEGTSDLIQWNIHYNYDEASLGDVVLVDTVDHGTVDISSLEVYQLSFDNKGTVIARTLLDPSAYTVLQNSNQSFTLSILNSDGKAYDISYVSQAPVGYDGTIINAVDDTNDETKPAYGKVDVNTIPSGSKVANQIIIDGIPYVQWTITINQEHISVGTIDLVDFFSAQHMKLDTNSFVLTSGGTIVDSSAYTIDTNYQDELGNTGFHLMIENGGSATYILTYRTSYTELGIKEPQTANNATLVFNSPTSDGRQNIGPSSQAVTEANTITAQITGPQPGIQKNGAFKYSALLEDQYIEWTITFNTSQLILNEPYIEDTISSNLTLLNLSDSEHIRITTSQTKRTLQEGVDYTLDWDLNSQTFTIYFIGNTNAESYVITYLTTAPQDNTVAENTATLYWQGQPAEATKSLDARTITASKTYTIRTEGTDRYIDWTVTFNTQKNVIYNFSLTDTLTPSNTTNVGNFVLKDETGNLVDASTYSITLNDNGTFTLTIPKTKNVKYTLTYSTILTPEAELSTTTNKISYTYTGGTSTKTASKTVPAYILTVDEQSLSIDKTKDVSEINWQVIANGGLVNLVDALFTNTVNDDQTLIADSILVEKLNDQGVYETINITPTVSGNTFKLDLPDGPTQYRVSYQSQIIQYPALEESGYEALATIVTSPSTTKSQTATSQDSIQYYDGVDENIPLKQGAQNLENDHIEWEAIINPDSQPFTQATIVDQLGLDGSTSKHHYIEDSIMVYMYFDDGEVLIPSDYYTVVIDNQSSLKTFTIVFNQTFSINYCNETYTEYANQINHAYKITYETEINSELKGIITIDNQIGILSNTNYNWSEEKEVSLKVEKWYVETDFSGSATLFSLQKLDAKDNTPLANVEFTLQRVSDTDNQVTNTYNVTTDENGQINTEIRPGRYYLIETQGLFGYQDMSSNPIKLIIEQDENNQTNIILDDTTWSTPSQLISVHDQTLIVYNEHAYESITATKVWTDNTAHPTIWLQLWHTDSNQHSEPVPDAVIYELNDGETNATWDHIEIYDSNNNLYTFTVLEVNENGEPWVPENYRSEINGLTITNTLTIQHISLTETPPTTQELDQERILPNTGSPKTKENLALLGLGIIIIMLSKHKKRKNS